MVCREGMTISRFAVGGRPWCDCLLVVAALYHLVRNRVDHELALKEQLQLLSPKISLLGPEARGKSPSLLTLTGFYNLLYIYIFIAFFLGAPPDIYTYIV